MAPSSENARSDVVVDAVLNFIKAGNLQPGSEPGFQHALRLSYNTIDKARLKFQSKDKTLTYRYRFASPASESTADEDADGMTTTILYVQPSIGSYTALMDDLSTCACFGVGNPCPPGLSLQMQTELLVNAKELKTAHEIDIINVVTKLGRTVSHSRTDFVCVDTCRTLAYSSHVKYMPTGSYIMDMLFRNKLLYGLYEKLFFWWHGKNKPALFEDKALVKDVIQTHLEHVNVGRATFHITREHTNPFGVMHGGAHALVMEQVGLQYARTNLKVLSMDEEVLLEAIQIDYIRAAPIGSVEVVCDTIGDGGGGGEGNGGGGRSKNDTLHLRVMLRKDGKLLSDGKLRFRKLGPNEMSEELVNGEVQEKAPN